MNRTTSLAFAGVVFSLASFSYAQTISVPASVTVDFSALPGSADGAFNTILTNVATVSSAYQFGSKVVLNSGTITSVISGTWEREAYVRMNNSAFPTLNAYFSFSSATTTFTSFSVTAGTERDLGTQGPFSGPASTLIAANLPSGSTWTLEFYESFSDGSGADAQGTDISFTTTTFVPPPPPAGAIDLGSVSLATSPVTATISSLTAGQISWYKFTLPVGVDINDSTYCDLWTSDGGGGVVDTEIGLYASTGQLVSSNDDVVTLFSILTYGFASDETNGFDGFDGATLAAGTYYLAVGRFNVTFTSPFTVTSTGPAVTVPFQLNLRSNVAAPALVNITGNLICQDTLSPFAAPRTMSYAVKQGSSTIASGTVAASTATTAYSIQVPASASGSATIEWDGASFLLRKTAVTLTGSNVSGVNSSLQNGDSDNSGEVDAADIDLVIADFGGTGINTDVDASGEVDAADIDIVIANFGGFND